MLYCWQLLVVHLQVYKLGVLMKQKWIVISCFLLMIVLGACEKGDEIVVETAVSTPLPLVEKTVRFGLKVPDAQMLVQLRMNPEEILNSSNNLLNLEPLELFYPDHNVPEQVGWWSSFVEGYVSIIDHDCNYIIHTIHRGLQHIYFLILKFSDNLRSICLDMAYLITSIRMDIPLA